MAFAFWHSRIGQYFMESVALHSNEQNKNNRENIGDELDTAPVGCRIDLVVFPLRRTDLTDWI